MTENFSLSPRLEPYRGRIIDTMMGLPHVEAESAQVYGSFIDKVADRGESRQWAMPAGYMFSNPPEFSGTTDPVETALENMNQCGVGRAVIGVNGHLGKQAQDAVRNFPDRFLGQVAITDTDPVSNVQLIEDFVQQGLVTSVSAFPSGLGIPIDDARMYPIYAACVKYGLPIFVTCGVPGPRLPLAPQKVELIDRVMYDFPDLTFVMRHGAEPWTDLAIKLLLKWPGLYYSTSAFAPKYYPENIIHYGNTRGANKLIYAGYYPMGLSLQRIFTEMEEVPFEPEVWEKFLFRNAQKVLGIESS